MFRALEQHFGLATTRLLCFDLITGRGEPHIQFIIPGRGRNVTGLRPTERGMDWKRNLGALIESTMAVVKDVKREPIPDLPLALRTAEQALADTSKPITARATVAPTVWPASERDEIRQRVRNFKAHQEKMAREREDYYLQVKARMLAPVDPNPALVHPTKNPTVPLRTL
jgi:hypothetical protein